MKRRPDTLTATAEPSAAHHPESILVAYALIRTALARRDAHMEQLLSNTREGDALTPEAIAPRDMPPDSGRMAA